MIGIDLVAVERIAAFMGKYGEKGLRRFLSPEEILLSSRPESIAGLWAAKEACSKALGCGISSELGFHDMRISKNPKGAPVLELSQRAREHFGIISCSLSITHDRGLAIAVVAVQKALP